jgi:hypothetical protein
MYLSETPIRDGAQLAPSSSRDDVACRGGATIAASVLFNLKKLFRSKKK